MRHSKVIQIYELIMLTFTDHWWISKYSKISQFIVSENIPHSYMKYL